MNATFSMADMRQKINLRAGAVLVSFGMESTSKHWSFPRKRESTPSAAHFQWLAE
jgi:hypothetical protein